MVVFVNSSLPISVRSTERIIASAMLPENGCPTNWNMQLLWKLSEAILIRWHPRRRQQVSMLLPIQHQHSTQTPLHSMASQHQQKILMAIVSQTTCRTIRR